MMSDVTRNGKVEHDAVDDLLRDYFQRELPREWPPAAALRPAAVSKPRIKWRRSHLGLAASVLALIGGISLAGKMLNDGPSRAERLPSDPTATNPKKGLRPRVSPSTAPMNNSAPNSPLKDGVSFISDAPRFH
jgi:hypothetical protein